MTNPSARSEPTPAPLDAAAIERLERRLAEIESRVAPSYTMLSGDVSELSCEVRALLATLRTYSAELADLREYVRLHRRDPHSCVAANERAERAEAKVAEQAREIERLKALIPLKPDGDHCGPHGVDPTDCGTFNDCCHCTVGTLEHVSESLDALQARLDAWRPVVEAAIDLSGDVLGPRWEGAGIRMERAVRALPADMRPERGEEGTNVPV